MSGLRATFQSEQVHTLDMQVPQLALNALRRISEITGATEICIAGGFPRGLYMQQRLGLTPQMNDIDVFANISVEDYLTIEAAIKETFGTPVRFHIRQFEKEERPRGLVEFSLPERLRKDCAGVESIQLNFGAAHPWAEPAQYITQANVGMNQVAIRLDGTVIASDAFVKDMRNKTMTMNMHRPWTLHDWTRTTKSLERMVKEREEFRGWKCIFSKKPYVPTDGTFWENPQPDSRTFRR